MQSTDKTEIYKSQFMTELKKFLVWLNDIIPTPQLQKIITVFEKLNKTKTIARFHKLIETKKEQVLKHDKTLFDNHCFIVPEVNLSLLWQNLPENEHEKIWEFLKRLVIICNIIYSEKVTPVTPQKSIQTPTAEHKENISISGLVDEMKQGEIECNPISGILEQLKNVDKTKIPEMTNKIKDILMPNINNPKVAELFGGLLNDIGDELKTNELSPDNFFNTILEISKKMSTKLANNAINEKCSHDDIVNSTKDILKNVLDIKNDNVDFTDALSNPQTLTALMSKMTNAIQPNSDQSTEPIIDTTKAAKMMSSVVKMMSGQGGTNGTIGNMLNLMSNMM